MRLEKNIANVLGNCQRPLVFVYDVGPKHAASVPECPTILLGANTSSLGLKRHEENSAEALGNSQRLLGIVYLSVRVRLPEN